MFIPNDYINHVCLQLIGLIFLTFHWFIILNTQNAQMRLRTLLVQNPCYDRIFIIDKRFVVANQIKWILTRSWSNYSTKTYLYTLSSRLLPVLLQFLHLQEFDVHRNYLEALLLIYCKYKQKSMDIHTVQTIYKLLFV